MEITLTQDQEKKLLELWNADPSRPPGQKELTQALFGQDCDGRSAEGIAVRKALAKHNIRPRTTGDPQKTIILNEDQKKFIDNNLGTMNSLEIARVLFNNPVLTSLHAESRSVQSYLQTVRPTLDFAPGTNRDIPTEEYHPPECPEEAMDLVNRYLGLGLKIGTLTPPQKKSLNTLIGYLHTYRLIAQMNNYPNVNDRTLCEDAFVRSTWDKTDLAQEEVDQYIEYANQVVTGFTVQRRSNQLQANLENITASNDENIKISMSLVEAIGKASTEYHQCLARQQKLLDDLKEKRSDRLSKQVKENASILNLIQMWKAEETRQELLAHAEKEQRAMVGEVGRLSSLSELKARILGLSKEEILNG
jgi:hypothetical protein